MPTARAQADSGRQVANASLSSDGSLSSRDSSAGRRPHADGTSGVGPNRPPEAPRRVADKSDGVPSRLSYDRSEAKTSRRPEAANSGADPNRQRVGDRTCVDPSTSRAAHTSGLRRARASACRIRFPRWTAPPELLLFVMLLAVRVRSSPTHPSRRCSRRTATVVEHSLQHSSNRLSCDRPARSMDAERGHQF